MTQEVRDGLKQDMLDKGKTESEAEAILDDLESPDEEVDAEAEDAETAYSIAEANSEILQQIEEATNPYYNGGSGGGGDGPATWK